MGARTVAPQCHVAPFSKWHQCPQALPSGSEKEEGRGGCRLKGPVNKSHPVSRAPLETSSSVAPPTYAQDCATCHLLAGKCSFQCLSTSREDKATEIPATSI